jgi:hypothetical protein
VLVAAAYDAAARTSTVLLHSGRGVHATPLPMNPALHVHVNDATVFAHAACASQLCTPVAHSSTAHVTRAASTTTTPYMAGRSTTVSRPAGVAANVPIYANRSAAVLSFMLRARVVGSARVPWYTWTGALPLR